MIPNIHSLPIYRHPLKEWKEWEAIIMMTKINTEDGIHKRRGEGGP